MEHARFDFHLHADSTLNSTGSDILKVLFSANKGIDFSELRKIASVRNVHELCSLSSRSLQKMTAVQQ